MRNAIINRIKGFENMKVLTYTPVHWKESIKLKSRHKLEHDERITIISNTMSKAIFASENSLRYAAMIIEPLIEYTYEELLRMIRPKDSALPKKSLDEKSETADLVFSIGELLIDVEFNNKDRHSRNIEYLDRLYSSYVNVGGPYNYKAVLLIEVNNFYHENHPETIMRYGNCDLEGHELLEQKAYIEIYIPNLRKKYYNKEVLNRLERIILAMVEPSIKVTEELIGGDDILEEFTSEMRSIEKDEHFIEKYDQENDYAEAMAAMALEQGLEQGLERGLVLGEKNNKIEMAKNMLSLGYKEKDICKIYRMTSKELTELLND